MHFRKFFCDQVDSSNLGLRRLLECGEAGHFSFLRAACQDGGYGRGGRAWHSPRGNLYVSFAVSSPRLVRASQLGFVMSLAVYDMLGRVLARENLVREDLAREDFSGLRLKWPNDILYAGGKLGGLLLEICGDYVIIGVGVNLVSAPESLSSSSDYRASCLRAIMGGDYNEAYHSAEVLCDLLADMFAERYDGWCRDGFASLLRVWESCAHVLGESLSVHWRGELRRGVYAGLGEGGALLLEVGGDILEISAGDVFLGEGENGDAGEGGVDAEGFAC